MPRFRGTIGMKRGSIETRPGIYETRIEEIEVSGDMRNQTARWPGADMRKGLTAGHILSIVTPEDSVVDFTEVAYVVWQARKWEVDSMKYMRPRVELTLGGLYSG